MLSSKLSFLLSTFLGVFLVAIFYDSNFYPFENVDLLYYVENINFILTGGIVSPKITLYLIGIFFALIYHFLFFKIKTPIFFKGLLTSMIVFIVYLAILMIFFNINRLAYMYIYLIQDLLALIIFYFTISLFYRRA